MNYILMIGGAGSVPLSHTLPSFSQDANGIGPVEENDGISRLAYTPLRSRLGGVMLPTLASMQRVSLCLSILGQCISCPLGLDALNRVVFQTTQAAKMSAGAGADGDNSSIGAEMTGNGAASGSTVGNIVRRVLIFVDIRNASQLETEQWPTQIKTRLTRSLHCKQVLRQADRRTLTWPIHWYRYLKQAIYTVIW